MQQVLRTHKFALKHRCKSRVFAMAVAPALLLAGGAAWADETFRATAAITLPNATPSTGTVTSFDISFVDPVIGLYLLADRTNKTVDVIDTETNKVLVQLGTGLFAGPGTSTDVAGPDGVLTVGHREVWAGDGDSTIKVIDLFSQALTHTISTGGAKRADELCLDPRDHLVMIANDAETPFPFVSLVSTVSYGVLRRITMDGTFGTPKATNGIEQCQWSRRTGKFYVNIPEVNGPGNDTRPGAVLVISPKTMAVEKTFNIPIGLCAGPQGMALGPDHQILLGCNVSASTVIIDERDGSVVKTLQNEGGSDEAWFNEGDGHYFLAESSPSFSTINQFLGVINSDPIKEDQSVVTGLKSGNGGTHGTAHSVAADPVLNQVYVPIPSTSGGKVCSSAGGNDSLGCIAVFTAPRDDPSKVAQR